MQKTKPTITTKINFKKSLSFKLFWHTWVVKLFSDSLSWVISEDNNNSYSNKLKVILRFKKVIIYYLQILASPSPFSLCLTWWLLYLSTLHLQLDGNRYSKLNMFKNWTELSSKFILPTAFPISLDHNKSHFLRLKYWRYNSFHSYSIPI